MGLGKTVQTLAHILIEREAGRLDLPALVVAPTSVLPNWRAEPARFAPRAARARLARTQAQGVRSAQIGRSRSRAHDLPAARPRQGRAAGAGVPPRDPGRSPAGQERARHRLRSVVQPAQGAPPPVPHRHAAGEPPGRAVVAVPLPDAGLPGRRRHLPPPVPHADREARRRAAARSAWRGASGRSCCAGPRSRSPPSCRPRPRSCETIELAGAQRDLYETVRAAMHERVRAEIAARGLAQSQIVVLDALLKLRQVCCDPRLLKLDAAKKVKDSAKLDAAAGDARGAARRRPARAPVLAVHQHAGADRAASSRRAASATSSSPATRATARSR